MLDSKRILVYHNYMKCKCGGELKPKVVMRSLVNVMPLQVCECALCHKHEIMAFGKIVDLTATPWSAYP